MIIMSRYKDYNEIYEQREFLKDIKEFDEFE